MNDVGDTYMPHRRRKACSRHKKTEDNRKLASDVVTEALPVEIIHEHSIELKATVDLFFN
jgi:hypothetical protein